MLQDYFISLRYAGAIMMHVIYALLCFLQFHDLIDEVYAQYSKVAFSELAPETLCEFHGRYQCWFHCQSVVMNSWTMWSWLVLITEYQRRHVKCKTVFLVSVANIFHYQVLKMML